jgi:hypothetical protein
MMQQQIGVRVPSQLTQAWAAVETVKKAQRLIVVASAAESDDTERAARGLALAAAGAGRQTAYVYLGRGTRKQRSRAADYAELSLNTLLDGPVALQFGLASWFTTYDVVVAELPMLLSCALGAHIAGVADGIIVAASPNRKVTLGDRELKALFSRLQCQIVGLIATAPVGSGAASFPLEQP